MATAREIEVRFWVQWDGSTYTNEGSRVLNASGSMSYKPPGQTFLGGQGQVSRMRVSLENSDRKLSTLNKDSAIYDDIKEGKIFRRRCYMEVSIDGGSTFDRVFTGVIKGAKESGVSLATLGVLDLDCRSLEELYLHDLISTSQANLSADYELGKTEANFIEDWLGLAGVSSSDMTVDPGLFSVPYAWMDNESPIEEIWKIAFSAGGQFYCDPDGEFRYENASHLLSHSSSVFTISRSNITGISYAYDDTAVFSDITVTFSQREQGIEALIWEPDEVLLVPADTTITVDALFRQPLFEIGTTDMIATNGSGIDISGDVSLSITYSAQRAEVELTNANTVYPAFVQKLQITGKPLVGGPSLEASASSTKTYWNGRERKKKDFRSNVFVQTRAQAQALADMMLGAQEKPRVIYSIAGYSGQPSLRLGDRITISDDLVMLDSDTPYSVQSWVTGINWSLTGHTFKQNLTAMSSEELYPFADDEEYFVIGTDTLGSTEVLFY